MQVKFVKLILKNFMGIKKLEINFEKELNQFKAPTGYGKTTILNGIRYCLGQNIGKSLPSKDNQQLRDLETSCSLYVSIDDKVHRLTRGNVPTSKTNPITGEVFFDGNIGTYEIDAENDLTAKKYKEKVENIFNLSSDQLELLSNPYSFNEMKWEDRRSLLNGLINSAELCKDLVKSSEYKELFGKKKKENETDIEIDADYNINEIALDKSFTSERKKITSKQKENKAVIDELQSRTDYYSQQDFVANFGIDSTVSEKIKNWLIADLKESISTLRVENINLAVKDAEIVKKMILVKEFTLQKKDIIQPKIDTLFDGIKFSLYDTVISTNELSPKCDTILARTGSTYAQASCGEQIQIDFLIGKGLRKLWNIEFPIIIDEAQSCTLPLETECQKIELITDKEGNFVVEKIN